MDVSRDIHFYLFVVTSHKLLEFFLIDLASLVQVLAVWPNLLEWAKQSEAKTEPEMWSTKSTKFSHYIL